MIKDVGFHEAMSAMSWWCGTVTKSLPGSFGLATGTFKGLSMGVDEVDVKKT